MAKKHTKLQLVKTFTQYGIHIWAILIIANAALAYAFHFSTQAATPEKQTIEDNLGPRTDLETNTTPTTKPQKPKGAVLDLTFTIPGIGSGSGVMDPARLTRNVTVFLYSPDSNSLNPSVKPLYTIKGTASYDTNKASPTYTSYLIKGLDFGSDVKDGKYQIVFRTDESLRTIIKENPTNIGGQLFDVTKTTKLRRIPSQTVLMGDTLPKEGDNIVDISDYNAFVNCFGDRSTSSFCTGNNYGDFDDNGIIDGIDYNLLLRSFQALLKQGQTIPKVTLAPTGPQRVSRLSNINTPTPVKKKPTPTKAQAQKVDQRSSGNVLGGILFFIFILVAGATIFFLYKKNEKFRTIVKTLLHKSPPGTPPPAPADPNAPTTDTDAAAATPPPAETPPTTDTTAAADPTAIAASTEIPVDQATPAADPTTAPAQAQPADGESIEKDYYVKKKLPGDANGVWLTLTDDNGALEAHYAQSDVEEGFAKVKGVMKTENGKTFLEISELTAAG